MSSTDEEFVPSPTKDSKEAHSRKHVKVLKISPAIFGRCSSNELNAASHAASQDDPIPIPGSSQVTNPKKSFPFRCPKCLRYFDSGTELIEHFHDHKNTGEERKFRCRKCNTENVVAYNHYEGYFYGDPNRRVIGMHCEECLKQASLRPDLGSGRCRPYKTY